jgi:hypothetical protein
LTAELTAPSARMTSKERYSPSCESEEFKVKRRFKKKKKARLKTAHKRRKRL